MPMIKTNGVPGSGRRRKQRAATAANPIATDILSGAADLTTEPAGLPSGAEAGWLGRVDALAITLADLDDRGTIVEHMVSETMQLLPAEAVVVRADAPEMTAPAFTEDEGEPARAVIPLAVGGRHFGAVEIAMKPGYRTGPGERALSIALARQCALALDRLALRHARRDEALAPAVIVAAPVSSPEPVAAPGALSAAEAQLALDRLAADLRTLATLARSASLPHPRRIDEAERIAAQHVAELRDRLGGRALD